MQLFAAFRNGLDFHAQFNYSNTTENVLERTIANYRIDTI